MTTATANPTAARAAVDLAAVREQWGDLLAAIERPPAAEWPPRESRGFVDQLADPDPAEQVGPEPVIGRTPLVLRQHPAPANLDALDAALAVERAVFELADRIAEQVQRPIRRIPIGHLTPHAPRARFVEDPDDAADPARWHYQAPTSPGSRAYGLHWACVWVEGRLLGDQLDGDLFRPVPARLVDEAARTAAEARRHVERALNRDRRTTTLDQPCPWCGGALVGHTVPGDPGATVITCGTGPDCPAPVPAEQGRRTWRAADLPDLYAALTAADRR